MADLIDYKPTGDSPFAPQTLYGIIDPDYARVYTQARIIAWQYGFCCVMQGSFTRDLDLLLVPWEERAYAKIVPAVINRIAEVTGTTVKGEPSDKPHGRKAYTLFLPDGVRWVDLSVMPRGVKGPTPYSPLSNISNDAELEEYVQERIRIATAITPAAPEPGDYVQRLWQALMVETQGWAPTPETLARALERAHGVPEALAEQCAEHGECTEKAMGEPECVGQCKVAAGAPATRTYLHPTRVDALIEVLEGECDGLAVSRETAEAILHYLDGNAPSALSVKEVPRG